jgi:hypothetical protein
MVFMITFGAHSPFITGGGAPHPADTVVDPIVQVVPSSEETDAAEGGRTDPKAESWCKVTRCVSVCWRKIAHEIP